MSVDDGNEGYMITCDECPKYYRGLTRRLFKLVIPAAGIHISIKTSKLSIYITNKYILIVWRSTIFLCSLRKDTTTCEHVSCHAQSAIRPRNAILNYHLVFVTYGIFKVGKLYNTIYKIIIVHNGLIRLISILNKFYRKLCTVPVGAHSQSITFVYLPLAWTAERRSYINLFILQ